jgi:acetyl-CoA acetyltransferase
MSSDRDLVVLGAGMHPWGKWGQNFVEYGLVAARAALADAGVKWSEIDFVAGADTIRNGYPGFVAGSTFSQALGWTGAQISSSYAACASGAQALQSARAQLLAGFAEVAMVIGADTTPKGFFAPVGGERKDDPDWQRFHLLGATNPSFFALNARRRIDVYGDTTEDFALVKVKNSAAGVHNPYARFRKEFTLDDFASSPIVSDPLRLLDICATSDGAACVIICTPEYAKRKLGTLEGTVRIRAVANTTPTYPQVRLELPDIATDSDAVVPAPPLGFKDSIAHNAYEQAGLGPEDVSCAEVYDLSTALELDWYENLGFCAPGEGAKLVRDGVTALGGAKPVNASGGLASFGEAIPAQAIAQVCELTWQLQGRCEGHQVENANVGLAINQGLFGHGSCTILSV